MSQQLVDAYPQQAINTNGTTKILITAPAVNWLRGIRLRISLTINNAGAKTVHADGLARFFSFRYFHDSDPLIDLTGHSLKAWLEEIGGRVEQYTEFTTASGNETGTWDLFIPFSCYELFDPDATMLDLTIGKNNRLEILCNGISAISPTAGTTIVSGTVDAEFVTYERDPSVPLAQVLPMLKVQEDYIQDLTASTRTQKRRFNTGHFVRRLGLIVEDAATTIARSNTIVADVERKIAQASKGIESFAGIRAENWQQKPIIGLTTPRPGIAWFRFDMTKTLDQRRLLNLVGHLQAELSFGTNAAANGIRVMLIRELVVPANRQAQAEVAEAAAVQNANAGLPANPRRRFLARKKMAG